MVLGNLCTNPRGRIDRRSNCVHWYAAASTCARHSQSNMCAVYVAVADNGIAAATTAMVVFFLFLMISERVHPFVYIRNNFQET